MPKDSSPTLFEDAYVKLTEDAVHIKWYYFPTGTSKVIPYADIRNFEVKPMAQMSFADTKTWGMALSPIWWPLDWGRLGREAVLLFDTGGATLAAVTPPQFQKVATIVRERMRVASEGAPLITSDMSEKSVVSEKSAM